ncbi:hypothetical protein HDU93_000312 [Gonapodya sp. JEL0774]|nr:hypothetical protein HDU93_000312 [Gonapodya sp. JEL0774]
MDPIHFARLDVTPTDAAPSNADFVNKHAFSHQPAPASGRRGRPTTQFRGAERPVSAVMSQVDQSMEGNKNSGTGARDGGIVAGGVGRGGRSGGRDTPTSVVVQQERGQGETSTSASTISAEVGNGIGEQGLTMGRGRPWRFRGRGPIPTSREGAHNTHSYTHSNAPTEYHKVTTPDCVNAANAPTAGAMQSGPRTEQVPRRRGSGFVRGQAGGRGRGKSAGNIRFEASPVAALDFPAGSLGEAPAANGMGEGHRQGRGRGGQPRRSRGRPATSREQSSFGLEQNISHDAAPTSLHQVGNARGVNRSRGNRRYSASKAPSRSAMDAKINRELQLSIAVAETSDKNVPVITPEQEPAQPASPFPNSTFTTAAAVPFSKPAPTRTPLPPPPPPGSSPRAVDIYQLHRRYPATFRHVDSTDFADVYEVELVPTDPDFPFDLPGITLRLTVPTTYPAGSPRLSVMGPNSLPDNLRRKIQRGFDTWSERSGKDRGSLVKCVAWIDRNLETLLVVDSAVEARPSTVVSKPGNGITFVANESRNDELERRVEVADPPKWHEGNEFEEEDTTSDGNDDEGDGSGRRVGLQGSKGEDVEEEVSNQESEDDEDVAQSRGVEAAPSDRIIPGIRLTYVVF